MSEELDLPESKRIFINNVDCYQGKFISKYLSECVVGASVEQAEEEEDAKSVDSAAETKPKIGLWKVLGTKKNADSEKPSFVSEILQRENQEMFYEQVIESDVIVYDINDDPDQVEESMWLLNEIHTNIDKLPSQKIFILISPVMTWCNTKQPEQEEELEEIPFTEDDYRKRKCHPNFKDHLNAEKEVIRMGKTNKRKLLTFVVCAGLPYGEGENIFHYLFKSAWNNEAELQCFGDGQNIVPTIHITDLAAVIQNIADTKPKTRYIVAVDDSQNTLEEIVRAVSNHLGTGKYKCIDKEEAFLNRDIKQADFDRLLVNLRMESVFVKENMSIRWKAETGLAENVTLITKEYKDTRKLVPLRMCILGPPAVGKSTLAKKVCEHYKLHHIRVKEVIDEGRDNLEKVAALADQQLDEEEEEEIDETLEGRAQEAQETLDAISESKDEKTGRIDDQYVIRFFREKLFSKPCQNQGFILDGYPKTKEQAAELFAVLEGEEEEEESASQFDPLLMPEYVFVLDTNGNDDFLKDRIMMLPEREVQETHNTEEGLLRRLADYRHLNTEDETVANYFDELEIHPKIFDVTTDTSRAMQDTIDKLKKVVGDPRNYGPSPEEIEETKRKEVEEARKKKEEKEREERRRNIEEASDRKRLQAEWETRLEDIKKEEYERLETQALPLRNYLVKHVMPTLTTGLVECCKVRPDDPVDFLAEYLFKNNPQVD